ANVADVPMRPERVPEALAQSGALPLHGGEQIVADDHSLHGQGRSTRDRVADIRVTVLEKTAAGRERRANSVADEHGADRRVTAAKTLGDREQVRRDALLGDGVQR